MKKVFFVAVASVFLLSCKVYRNIKFNGDQSGNLEYKIDFSQLMAMAGGEGMSGSGMNNLADSAQLQQTLKMYESISGIKNATATYDTNGIITTGYDFDNMDALVKALNVGGSNQLMGAMGGGSEAPKVSMTYKGKKFSWTELDKDILKKMKTTEFKDQMQQMDMVLSSSEVITSIEFPVEVKKVSDKAAIITNSNKTVSLSKPMKEFLSPAYKPLVINLK